MQSGEIIYELEAELFVRKVRCGENLFKCLTLCHEGMGNGVKTPRILSMEMMVMSGDICSQLLYCRQEARWTSGPSRDVMAGRKSLASDGNRTLDFQPVTSRLTDGVMFGNALFMWARISKGFARVEVLSYIAFYVFLSHKLLRVAITNSLQYIPEVPISILACPS